MHHPIVFVPVAEAEAANAAIVDLLGAEYAFTFGMVGASPDGSPPMTEYYALFGVDEAQFAELSAVWTGDFPAGAVYDAVPGQTYPALMAALTARNLVRVEID